MMYNIESEGEKPWEIHVESLSVADRANLRLAYQHVKKVNRPCSLIFAETKAEVCTENVRLE